ncbi:MAG: DUF1759 domain-containing protein [Candidatus Competibacteraceae bacterium]|nr:DUF1759 domain-containing protein [Candidatus Competibacteraceae bacterium]
MQGQAPEWLNRIPAPDPERNERLAGGKQAYCLLGSKTWQDERHLERLRFLLPAVAEEEQVHPYGPYGYHTELPEPWNVPVRPAANGCRGTEFWHMQKSGQLTFNGERDAYPFFRGQFIANVHQEDCNVNEKCQALIIALRQAPRCKSMIQVTAHTRHQYAAIIRKLENMFGGSEGLIYEMRSRLRQLPRLKRGSLEDLEDFVNKAQAYIETVCTKGAHSECLAGEFTALISDHLPQPYHDLISTWLNITTQP